MSKAFRRNDVVNEYARTLIRVKAKQLVRRPGFGRFDQDDIEQDLVLHLLNQARHFDPARASLNTFIARVVDSAVAMLVRERGRIKRGSSVGNVQSLEKKVEQYKGPPSPLWAIILPTDLERRTGGASLSDAEYYELAEGVASVLASMPPDLQKICRSLLELNRAETQRALRLPRRCYEAAVELIREYFARANLTKN